MKNHSNPILTQKNIHHSSTDMQYNSMPKEFVHLHCHTEYSTLDSTARIKQLAAKAGEYGMPAVAMTDHGNLFARPRRPLREKRCPWT